MLWKKGQKPLFYSVYTFTVLTGKILRFESTRAVSLEQAENNVRWRNFQDTPADSLFVGGVPVTIRAARTGSERDHFWMNQFRRERGLCEISFPESKELKKKVKPPHQPDLPGFVMVRNAQLL